MGLGVLGDGRVLEYTRVLVVGSCRDGKGFVRWMLSGQVSGSCRVAKTRWMRGKHRIAAIPIQ